jgi:hypothetical protein
MKDIIEDWITEPEDQDSRETREVYALAGLALYCAQCLEHEIVNVLALSAMLRRSLRRPPEGEEEDYEKYIDKVWDEGFQKTLGGLITSLRKSGVKVPTDLRNELARSLDARNRLVHAFFRERAELWFECYGRHTMADELKEIREQFVSADRALHALTEPLRVARGFSDRVVDRYVELRKRGIGEDQAMTMAIEENRTSVGNSPFTK